MPCPSASCWVTATVNTGRADGGRWSAPSAGEASFASIEVGQLLIASRVSDINDVLSGLLGTASGAAAFALVCWTQGERGQGGLVSRPICLWLVALNLGLIGFSALKPFVFSFYLKFSYTDSTMEERIAESYYAELEIEKRDEKIRAIRKELEDLKRKEFGGTGLDEPQYGYPLLPPERGPKIGPSSPPPEKEMAEARPPPRAGASGGSSSGREEEKGMERGSRAGLGPDVFEKQSFFDRMLKMAMKIVGFISKHPIAMLSLLVLYALLADLLGRAKGWGER